MRDDIFDDESEDHSGKHFSPQKAAKFLMKAGIGHYYKTHGALWDIEPQTRIIGLLECIYNAVSRSPNDPDARLEAHRDYLAYYHSDDTKLLVKLKRSLCRVGRMCGGGGELAAKSSLVRQMLRVDISLLAQLYAEYVTSGYRHYRHFELQRDIHNFIDLLAKIKTVDDLTLLDNVGPVTVAKIKRRINSEKGE